MPTRSHEADRMGARLGATPWWLWPTVLSLDAPLVALTWQTMFAHSLHVGLRTHHQVLLGSSVWLAYAGDRWIEAWSLHRETVQTHRHRFALTYRWPLFAFWACVLGMALAVAVVSLSRREWEASLCMLSITLLYLLSHQWLHRAQLWRLPKEFCVAAILSCGAALYPALQGRGSLAMLTLQVVSYALLALCNCVLISVWELEVDAIHQQHSLALKYPVLTKAIDVFPWSLSLALLLGGIASEPSTRHALLAASLSALLLGVVHLRHGFLGRRLSRVLADFVLLTPLVLLIW